MRKLLFLSAVFFGWSNFCNAAVITFDSGVEGALFLPSVTSDGFIATENVYDHGYPLMGTSIAGESKLSNGTAHLDSWTNYTSNSVWTLKKQGDQAFSISQFDFESVAYSYAGDSFAAATGLTVTGITATGNTVMQAFGPASSWTTEYLNSTFNNLVSVQFDAAGYRNRAGYDNIVVNTVTSIPEPSSLVVLAAGVLGVAVARSRRASWLTKQSQLS